ncbi:MULTISPECIES: CheR family methyltransferase [unclassified Variovorax]|uniref:CheR family methyltransferase n=1 Tax=unclassified Variovorax TaxID=663243 RepID=UPI00076DE73E|nr:MULTISPECIES: CheR family methyltransferase [unclassified Variovorax]KWT96982.1 Chemotaxis protein methyltransferase CheR [Variovorax sp. WDL1]PNG58539.1 Sensor protein EvgS [Variovorax sp. B4]PNG61671.1 Sensor protein EvgS [Variovorax sp. B2]VTV12283.1 Sensor protein EvgS precursor [Variovorax sp. WDL1]
MNDLHPDHIEEEHPELIDNVVPTRGYGLTPLVGLGGSAGAIPALQVFLQSVPPESGLAFVVVLHLAAERESILAEILQRATPMRVMQVQTTSKVLPNTVYVIPPGKAIKSANGYLRLTDLQTQPGRRMAVDYFFRALADTHGPHSAAIVLSGGDGDGAIGIKRIKERGGLTIAQDPDEAEHGSMPNAAIATGMVDWVLPVSQMAARLLDYYKIEKTLRLPPEEGAQPASEAPADADEAILREILSFLRARTGRDFSYYKRATIVRRIGRRMQVNGVGDLPAYLNCLRTRSGEAGALLQDLLISVTNFFRDAECFDALVPHLAELFAGKGPNDTVRVWVTACATGEEAYSIAMLLAEHARTLDVSPTIQVFGSDLDENAVQAARDGIYPAAIEADVSPERLRRFFVKEHGSYRVRRELRETVLFATHDLLKDSPFSRLDLVSCRNLLIYLDPQAQSRVFDVLHFALLPRGRLFLGTSESVEEGSRYFTVLDKKHRIYAQRPVPRTGVPVQSGPSSLALAVDVRHAVAEAPVIAGRVFDQQQNLIAERRGNAPATRGSSWGELHLKLLEHLGPPSVLVDAEHDIVHLSASAAQLLQHAAGEPTRNLLRLVPSALRIELRTALHRATHGGESVETPRLQVPLGGETRALTMRVVPVKDGRHEMTLVLFDIEVPGAAASAVPEAQAHSPLVAQLDQELDRMRAHLRDTVEQYETSTQELKASNEELQAINEELRSATEELETSREELQSINEELVTVNHELKTKVDELAHANSDMQNLMDATAIATIFLDRDLCITRYTPMAVRLFSLIPGDLGRPLSDLVPKLQYPELGADAQQVLERLAPVEREVGRPDGSWFLARLSPYRAAEDRIAGVVLSFIDVSDARRSAEALRRSEERLRLVVENARDYAIFSTDLELAITSWNKGAERLLGYTEAEALGQRADIIFTEEDRRAGAPAQEARTALTEERAADERFHVRKDGSRFWGSGTMMRMEDSSGAAVGFVKILRDQTQAREAQAALKRSQAELMNALQENEAARTRLEQADAAKDRFLAVLSHELRNPLAAVSSAAALLADASSTPQQREQAARIVRRQARTMKILLDDLLDVSRLTVGQLELHLQDVALSSIVEAALETAEPLLKAARHRLSTRLPDQPVHVRVDPLRIAQVIVNLLTNAAKYTAPGGKVSLQVEAGHGEVSIVVSDNGVGMAPETIERIFDLYAQGPAAAHRNNDGLGVGLALVRNIVRLHGGHVEAESDGLGKGSRFRVRLPLGSAPVAAPPQPPAAAPARLGRTRVLIVDDNEDAAWTLSMLLKAEGHETTIAASGAEALVAAERAMPDVAVLDIGMPGMNGIEVAERLRAMPSGDKLVVIALTGWGSKTEGMNLLARGFDRHLSKPIEADQLIAAMAQLLQERGRA